MNKTRITLLLYPVFATGSLWFTNALMTEHPPVWRARDWRGVALMALVLWAVLWLLLRRAKRDRLLDLSLALFDSRGVLTQQFESVFDLTTGVYKNGQRRYADGKVHKD